VVPRTFSSRTSSSHVSSRLKIRSIYTCPERYALFLLLLFRCDRCIWLFDFDFFFFFFYFLSPIQIAYKPLWHYFGQELVWTPGVAFPRKEMKGKGHGCAFLLHTWLHGLFIDSYSGSASRDSLE